MPRASARPASDAASGPGNMSGNRVRTEARQVMRGRSGNARWRCEGAVAEVQGRRCTARGGGGAGRAGDRVNPLCGRLAGCLSQAWQRADPPYHPHPLGPLRASTFGAGASFVSLASFTSLASSLTYPPSPPRRHDRHPSIGQIHLGHAGSRERHQQRRRAVPHDLQARAGAVVVHRRDGTQHRAGRVRSPPCRSGRRGRIPRRPARAVARGRHTAACWSASPPRCGR